MNYNGLPAVNAGLFNGFAEDERQISFFFDGKDSEAVDDIETKKITAYDEFSDDILALLLRNTKIFIATKNSNTERILSAMASGCLVLSLASDSLDKLDLKDNVHYSIYTNSQDLREQIDFYLHERIKRVCTARNGQYFVTSNHTKLKRKQ